MMKVNLVKHSRFFAGWLVTFYMLFSSMISFAEGEALGEKQLYHSAKGCLKVFQAKEGTNKHSRLITKEMRELLTVLESTSLKYYNFTIGKLKSGGSGVICGLQVKIKKYAQRISETYKKVIREHDELLKTEEGQKALGDLNSTEEERAESLGNLARSYRNWVHLHAAYRMIPSLG